MKQCLCMCVCVCMNVYVYECVCVCACVCVTIHITHLNQAAQSAIGLKNNYAAKITKMEEELDMFKRELGFIFEFHFINIIQFKKCKN